jgi:hypothetical protein
MDITIERRVAGVLTSADTALLRVTSESGTIWFSEATVAPTSAGIYSQTINDLPDGEYVARWTFEVAGIYRTFQIDQPVQYREGVTLAEIERHVAPRIGPFEELTTTTGSTENKVLVSSLLSSLDIGDYEDLYILRRGRFANGNLISGFNDDDRERLIASYEHSTGGLVPDRDWAIAPVEGELLELHYLKPSSELRRIVRQGLRRCYFWDTVLTSTTGASFNAGRTTVNLTSLVPWITRPNQVKGLRYGTGSSLPRRVLWSNFYRMGGSVYLETQAAGAGSFYIQGLRPHYTYVNGETSYTGPDDDDDLLYVDLDYAAAAAHIAAWMLFPHRLFPISNVGMRINMEAAAAVFTLESMRVMEVAPEYPEIDFGSRDALLEMPQVGNI